MSGVITYEVTGAVARLMLDRPHRSNGITRELVTELERRIEGADLELWVAGGRDQPFDDLGRPTFTAA